MRRLRTQRLSFLTEVTGPGLSDIRVHAFNHSAIRALHTVLDLAKLDFCKGRVWDMALGSVWVRISWEWVEKWVFCETERKKSWSGDSNHRRSLCECVVWEWGHEEFQSHIEETRGRSLSLFTLLPSLPLPVFSDIALFLVIFGFFRQGMPSHPVLVGQRYSYSNGDVETSPQWVWVFKQRTWLHSLLEWALGRGPFLLEPG